MHCSKKFLPRCYCWCSIVNYAVSWFTHPICTMLLILYHGAPRCYHRCAVFYHNAPWHTIYLRNDIQIVLLYSALLSHRSIVIDYAVPWYRYVKILHSGVHCTLAQNVVTKAHALLVSHYTIWYTPHLQHVNRFFIMVHHIGTTGAVLFTTPHNYGITLVIPWGIIEVIGSIFFQIRSI